MNALVLVSAEKHLTLYNGMCSAIQHCHSVDECEDIADKSVALAAYYKQIKDKSSTRMFHEVKLRAWRRISELFTALDFSKCKTQPDKIRLIRASFDDSVVAEMSDGRIAAILRLGAVPESSFEIAVGGKISGGIDDLLCRTPEHEKRHLEQLAEYERQNTPEEIEKRIKIDEELERKHALMEEYNLDIQEAAQVALGEVGITLERIERLKMKKVVFFIKEDVHEIMRKAAFDQRATMHEIMRRGLKMWLAVHDYQYPADD